MNWIYRFSSWLLCKIGSHDWVCEGIYKEPDERGIVIQPGEQIEIRLDLKRGSIAFAQMYCKRCGFNSRLTI